MGFDGVELIVLAPSDLDTIWSGSSLDRIEETLARANLEVSRFCVFGPCQRNIASFDDRRRAIDLATFERACAVAQRLRAPQIGYVGWPAPGTSPFLYELPKDAAPGTKITHPIPDGFDWNKFWARSVDSNKELLARARAHGLSISLEPHFHGVPQTAEQFLLLRREVNDPGLTYLLDSCWTSVQAAYPPLLAKMMAPHLGYVQFRDTDGATRNNRVPFGQGAVDFPALVAALKAVGYNGYVALEEVFMPASVAAEDAANFLSFMRGAQQGTSPGTSEA